MLDIGAFLLEQAQTSPQVQFVYDLTSQQVVFVNAAYEWVLGGRREQVNDELPALRQRLHPDDQAYLAECWARWTQGQLHDEVAFRLQMPDQPDQWLQLTPAYLAGSAGRDWVGGQLRDISTAQHYKANADSFNARKNMILEILSLDLADSLVLSQSLRHQVEGDVSSYIQERLVEGLRRIEALSQEGARLVEEFTSEEVQAAFTIGLSRERVELGEQLRQALQDYPRQEGLLALALHLDLPTYPVYVALDMNKFMQVVTNLLSNALKFTPDGGQLTIQLVVVQGVAHLTFADDGIGIPVALQPSLFERFTPARRPGLRGEPTLGVGLSICKMIVELHQGTIAVNSQEGLGATFIIMLPVLPG